MADRLPYESPTAFRRALTDKLQVLASGGRWTLAQLQRQIAYDRLLERLYLLDDGWIVSDGRASDWAVQQAQGTPQWPGALADDSGSSRTLVITNTEPSSPGALYVFDGTRWTSSPLPTPLQGRSGFGFTALTGVGLNALFWGGENLSTNVPKTYNDTWTYSAGTWQKVSA